MRVNLNLKIARVVKGLSQYDLSSETQISQPQISLIERGYFRPSEQQAEKIARALEVKVEDIFPVEKR